MPAHHDTRRTQTLIRPRDVTKTLQDAALQDVTRCVSQVQRFLVAMTRDGRLHPGLAPEVGGAIVSSEGKHDGFKVTPPQEMERILAEARAEARLGGRDGRQRSARCCAHLVVGPAPEGWSSRQLVVQDLADLI